MRDVAYSGAYQFTVHLYDGRIYRDLFTLDALHVATINAAKERVARLAAEYYGVGRSAVRTVTVERSSERFA